MNLERWHDLLTNRFVCEVCLTRYFVSYRRCRACGALGRIVPLGNFLTLWAHDDHELRRLIAAGQHPLDPPPEPHHAALGSTAGTKWKV